MQTFKVSDVPGRELFLDLNAQLKRGKQLKSEGEQLADAAKTRIVTWLKTERSFDIEAQPDKTIVIIQLKSDGEQHADCIKLERKGRNSLDVKRLRAEKADIAKEFATTTIATYIDAL